MNSIPETNAPRSITEPSLPDQPSGLSVIAGSPARPQTMDEWFLSLPAGRQAMLREDKWMLAQAAFIAGAQAGMREANDKISNSGA